MVNLTRKDAGKLNTIMTNACIRIGLQFNSQSFLQYNFPLYWQSSYRGPVCPPTRKDSENCFGIMPQTRWNHVRALCFLPLKILLNSQLLMLSGFSSCTSFPMSLFCSTQTKKTLHNSVFWCCWRLNTAVPLKVFCPSKTPPVKACTGHSPRRWIVAFKHSGQLA